MKKLLYCFSLLLFFLSCKPIEKIDYSIIDSWDVPNGTGMAITISKENTSDELLSKLINQIETKVSNNKYAFVWVFEVEDEIKKIDIKYLFSGIRRNLPTPKSEWDEFKAHFVGVYIKNDNSGINIFKRDFEMKEQVELIHKSMNVGVDESISKSNPSVEPILYEFRDKITEIEWMIVDGNTAYIGMNSTIKNGGAVCQLMATAASEACNSRFKIVAFDSSKILADLKLLKDEDRIINSSKILFRSVAENGKLVY